MKRWMLILALVVAGVSCKITDTTYSTANEKYDLSAYSSFAWIPKDSSSIENVLFDNGIVADQIRDNVNHQMKQRAFRMDEKAPDLLLQYTIVVEDKEMWVSSARSATVLPPGPRLYSPESYTAYDSPYSLFYYNSPGNVYNPYFHSQNSPYYPPYGYPSPTLPYYGYENSINVQKFDFEEGTLIVDMIDRKTNQLIWRGWSVEAISDPKEFEKRIPEEITDIFKQFPVNSAKR